MKDEKRKNEEYKEYMEATKETERYLGKIKGSLFGGAVGDALGYAVEFKREEEIFNIYGKDGIQEYKVDSHTGKALISDDTQMSLFTANGILFAETRRTLRGIGGPPSMYMNYFYEEWYETQHQSYEEHRALRGHNKSWLMEVPEVFANRAPGITCLDAIRLGFGSIEEPLNQSKGCGGIMRVAPLGMRYHMKNMRKLDKEGAKLAALTHGHSLGYMPAAMLVHIISLLVHDDSSLPASIEDAKAVVQELFAGDRHIQELIDIMNLAVNLAGNNCDDLTNIHLLGEGWVAEETLAIALYCSLRYIDDFSKAITVAVNHNGDSDSTGAVTGNIMGALYGYEAIENKWKQDLELTDVILEMATDLCHGCRMSTWGGYNDQEWTSKYSKGHRR